MRALSVCGKNLPAKIRCDGGIGGKIDCDIVLCLVKGGWNAWGATEQADIVSAGHVQTLRKSERMLALEQ